MLSRRNALQNLGGLAVAAALPRFAAAGTVRIRMAINSRYPPFSFLDAAGRMSGLLVDCLDLVGGNAGIAFDYDDLPWARGQEMVRTDQLDGFCTAVTAERRLYALFTSSAVYEEPAVLVHRLADRKAAAAATLDELRALKVGAQLGNSWAKDALPGIEITWGRSMESLLSMIAAERLDAALAGDVEAKAALAGSPVAGLLEVKLFPAMPTGGFHIGLRQTLPQAADLIARLDQSIKAERAAGALQAIAARYT
jgi:ABC-type amino acid transport substrate-binding protein